MVEQPYALAKRLEADIRGILATVDKPSQDAPTRQLLVRLQRETTDMRLDARDYEVAETRAAQAKLAEVAAKRLYAIRENMLLASQNNIFSAIEVAQLSAHIDRIIERLV